MREKQFFLTFPLGVTIVFLCFLCSVEVLSIDVIVTVSSPGKNRQQGIVAAKALLSGPFWQTYITQRMVLPFCKEKQKRMFTTWVTCDTESKMEVIVQGWGLLLRGSVETKGKTQDWAEEKWRGVLVYRKPQLARVVWRWPDPSEIPQVEARNDAGPPEKGVSCLAGWFSFVEGIPKGIWPRRRVCCQCSSQLRKSILHSSKGSKNEI